MDSNAPKKHNDNPGFDPNIFVNPSKIKNTRARQVLIDDSSVHGLLVRIDGQSVNLPYDITQRPTVVSESSHSVDLDAFQQAINSIGSSAYGLPQPHQPINPLQGPEACPPNRGVKRTREDFEEGQPVNPSSYRNQPCPVRNGNPQGQFFRQGVQNQFTASSMPGFWNTPMPMGNSYPMANNMGYDPGFPPIPANQPPRGTFMPGAYTMPPNGNPGFPVANQTSPMAFVPVNYGPNSANMAGPQGQPHGFRQPRQQVPPNGTQMRPLVPRPGPHMHGQMPGPQMPPQMASQMPGQMGPHMHGQVPGPYMPPQMPGPQMSHRVMYRDYYDNCN
ncbi:hypothetical protein FPOAC2_10490 [Fusarium poae]|uniref:Uncharacterized protein n=1 Tax=Fusarium poae TaxID=36050 RepID=A0A1B8AB62_FUSPO|nr:hypothetical protein FPOAC1_010214 [Fusarium poae]KAG8665419.1 hypothetical protein FPOAC1_010214 [Fusarium poae]OBS17720.1 hypothetical protein FPOA_09452 [Fusarium poae]